MHPNGKSGSQRTSRKLYQRIQLLNNAFQRHVLGGIKMSVSLENSRDSRQKMSRIVVSAFGENIAGAAVKDSLNAAIIFA